MGGLVNPFKPLTKAFKKVTKVTIGVLSGRYALKASSTVLKAVGNHLVDDILGLDKLGKEISRVGEHIGQVGKVLGGELHKEVEEIQDYQSKVEAFGKRVESAGMSYGSAAYRQNTDELMEKLDRLIAFDELFKMALKNRFKDQPTQTENSEYKELELLVKQYELMVRQLKQMISNLKSEFDFVIGLTEGPFLQKIAGSAIMVVGGLVNNVNNVISGEASSKDWKNIITVVLIVVAVVLTAGNAASAAAAYAAGTGTALASSLAMTALVLTVIGSFMTLDGMYANGAATGAIMSALDFVFNDLLNLNDFIGKDFSKFDKDNEDYQEMVGYTQLAIAVGALATSWGSSMANAPQSAAMETVVHTDEGFVPFNSVEGRTAMGIPSGSNGLIPSSWRSGISSTTNGGIVIGDTLASSSVYGVKLSTFQDIYEAFTTASNVRDLIAMNDQYNQLEDKLQSTAADINAGVLNANLQKTKLHVADSAYFLQDQQEYIDRYVWSMVSDSMYVDPYGTTPVANIRFQPDKDTRGLSFGFEDVFDESKQAGSRGYFNNILYGS